MIPDSLKDFMNNYLENKMILLRQKSASILKSETNSRGFTVHLYWLNNFSMIHITEITKYYY